MTSITRAALVLAAVSLAGCVSVLPDPPPAPFIYPLRASVPTGEGPTSPIVLGVGRPNAVQALSVLDVVWVRDGRIAYLERSVWSARAPEALQTLLAETISAQNLVQAAIRIGEGPQADYDVRWDLHAFQIEEAPGRLEGRFEAAVRLVRADTREVVAARPLRLAGPVPSREASVAVAVLQQLAAQGAAEIGAWAAAEAARDQAQIQAQR